MPPRSAAAVITVDGLVIEVVRRRMRRLRLVVLPPTGAVVLSAPRWVPRRDLEAFATAKLAWIRAQQERIRSLPPAPRVEYRSGEDHAVWGSPRRLEVVEAGRRARVSLVGDRLVLSVPPGADRAARARTLEGWHRRQVVAALPPLIAAWQAPLGVEAAGWSVRRMTTRWGSCTPRTRRLRFNSELATRRPELLEYVVVHELAHLVEPSHNARFKGLLSTHLPDWQTRHAELAARPIGRCGDDG